MVYGTENNLMFLMKYLSCLWYLKNCLKQETILQTPIPIEVFEVIVQQLVVWVFEAENLRSLVQIDEKTFFDVIGLFFMSPAVEGINKGSENIKLRCPAGMDLKEIELIMSKIKKKLGEGFRIFFFVNFYCFCFKKILTFLYSILWYRFCKV